MPHLVRKLVPSAILLGGGGRRNPMSIVLGQMLARLMRIREKMQRMRVKPGRGATNTSLQLLCETVRKSYETHGVFDGFKTCPGSLKKKNPS